MPTEANYDNYKTAMYQICKFLIDKKLSIEGKGLGRPLAVPLHEFECVIPYTRGLNDQETFEKLKNEIEGLAEERNRRDNPLLVINNTEILQDFISSYNQNKTLFLTYKRRDIEDYLADIEAGNVLIREKGKVIFDKDKLKFRLDGKYFSLRKTKTNYNVNLSLLLYGYETLDLNQYKHSIKSYAEQHADYDDYVDYIPGQDVDLNLIRNILLAGSDSTDANETEEKRFLTDAIRGINDRAKKELGVGEIFSFTSEMVKVKNL